MQYATLLAVARAGFTQRRSAISKLLSGADLDPLELLSGSSVSTSPVDLATDSVILDSLTQRFLSADITLTNYIAYMRSLLPSQYHDVILGYFFSSDFIDSPDALLETLPTRPHQASVILESLYLSDKLSDETLADVIHTEHTSLIRPILQKLNFEINIPGRQIATFPDFDRLLQQLGIPLDKSTKTLKDFQLLLNFSKPQLIHLLGPDFFTVFQRLQDPDAIYNTSLALRDFDFCTSWGCGDLFLALLLIRSSRNLATDMRSVQLIERSPRFSALSPETRLLHEDWHNSTKTSAEAIAAPGTFLKRICAIRDALEEENSELLIDEIISLYNTDKDAVTWIDWDGTYNRILYSDRLQGLKVSATHWLMGQPSVAKHFPIVHFAEGDGAFESSLRTSISNLEEKSLDRLAHELLKSTGHTRELLVTAILSPDTAGMLSIILQHDPHWAKKLGQAKAIKFDVRASALRSDIASVFAKHGLLDRDQEQAIVDEERSRLRVAYLQGRQLEGLVYVNWPHLGNQLDNEFSGQFSLVKRMLLQPNLDDPKTYFDEVVISLSERIAAYILIEGPDNLKTTVSDNLRHGQLPNRFLVAFDRAISFATNALVDPNTLIRELLLTQPASSHWLTSLRTDLISTIKDFNINSLTVWEPNDLKNKVTLAVRDVVKTILGNSNLPQQNELDERPQLSSCLHQLQTILDEFFFAARAELSQRLADYRTKLGNASTTLDATDFAFSDSRKRRFDKHRFFISLREQLDEAEQEALPWIALVKAREQPEAFYLNDVVQLCLVNHRSFGSRQLHVDVAVSERRAKHGIVTLQPEPLLHGRYFVFCETLTRNLLENAFKHSGLGLQCRPKIELILDASRLTFTCRNTVSAARYRYLQAHLPSLQDRATKGNLSAAGEDSGSGLQKARWSFWRFLDVIPTVRLRLIQSPISIEIAIEAKHNHGNIIAQESFDH